MNADLQYVSVSAFVLLCYCWHASRNVAYAWLMKDRLREICYKAPETETPCDPIDSCDTFRLPVVAVTVSFSASESISLHDFVEAYHFTVKVTL